MRTPRPKALISWSSGKDSAFALHEIRRAGEFDVVGALTTVTETFERVSIHGVRQEILRAQCEAAELPQRIVPIPYPCPNEIYEARMGEAVAQAVADGVTHMIFGDLFLADIRAYREQKLAGTGITPVFPLWERPTPELAQAMIASGLEAYLATVDLKKLPTEFAGRKFDAAIVGRSARWHRSLRRERRVSHLRGGGPDVCTSARGDAGRTRRARRLRVLRSGDGETPSSRRPGQAKREPEPITTGACVAKAGAAAECNNQQQWLWVPAFAGTTMRRDNRRQRSTPSSAGRPTITAAAIRA